MPIAGGRTVVGSIKRRWRREVQGLAMDAESSGVLAWSLGEHAAPRVRMLLGGADTDSRRFAGLHSPISIS